ncbi:MAG: hypothetical protein ACYCST_01660 [Acidimicrobiales bacterium]
MTTRSARPPGSSRRAECFAYEGFEIDPARSQLRCHYSLDGEEFCETVTMAGVDPLAWELRGAKDASLWVFLLLGLSYYKAGAPRVVDLVDLGELALTGADLDFLRECYLDGLGEFAFTNGLDLSDLVIKTRPAAMPEPTLKAIPAQRLTGSGAGAGAVGAAPPHPVVAEAARSAVTLPLVPFGGGIDSIVTTEILRRQVGDAGTSLFVLSKQGDRYAAIEAPASVTGLAIVRAERALDNKILHSRDRGYLNGHVPVTAMISAIATLAALLHGRDAVVMSNEASASTGNIEVDGRVVNHQWSKGLAFETGFRAAIARRQIPVEYFSLLRSASELWVAKRFAALDKYHQVFRSCNRAFYVDPTLRLDSWCGECDKCCFIDLVLSPFMARDKLEAIFDGREPLGNGALDGNFRALLDTASPNGSSLKPFDCVGDVPECREALRLTASRPDRAGTELLHRLVGTLPDEGRKTEGLLRLSGPNYIPDALSPADLLF